MKMGHVFPEILQEFQPYTLFRLFSTAVRSLPDCRSAFLSSSQHLDSLSMRRRWFLICPWSSGEKDHVVISKSQRGPELYHFKPCAELIINKERKKTGASRWNNGPELVWSLACTWLSGNLIFLSG